MERPAILLFGFSSLSTLARLVRSAESFGLSIQFVEQGFSLAERGRVEAFREPAVNIGEQSLRLDRTALRVEPPSIGGRRLQFVTTNRRRAYPDARASTSPRTTGAKKR